ncbi:MAG: Gfo/Idh/MocA family oxidoreductase [Candidatus Latescibacteria bacterium]|nr:Gfo/Idh/MocA family oxidoreductase [Candidatus Latescibacterota bacterium]
MNQSNHTSRRWFLKTAASAAGILSLGGLTPSSVLGANDKINFGVIGVGGMGTGHVNSLVGRSKDDNIEVVAISDCYKSRITRAVTICKEKQNNAEGYIDYRNLLDRKDIDAVLIATPDHWHSKITIEAMEAGKHVYCEKPLTLTVEQALAVRDAQKRYKKVLQVGPNFTAEDQFWTARDIIKTGRVGKVTWAQGTYNRNPKSDGAFGALGTINETAGPNQTGENYVDWDMWLGHKWGLAPRIPWNPDHFFRFRRYWRYNGGVATDLLYHRLAPLLIALAGPDGEYPRRVSAGGGLYIKKDGRDVPDVFMMTVDYPSEYTVFLESVLTNDTQIPTRIYGQYGTIEFTGQPVLRGNGAFVEEFRQKNDGFDQVSVHVKETRDLEGNFIDVIREGGRLHCNVDLGCTTMVAIKMAVESYRHGKTFFWDAENEKVIT